MVEPATRRPGERTPGGSVRAAGDGAATSTERRQRALGAFLVTWTIVGIAVVGWVGLVVLDTLRLAVIPLVLALFPAALLSPLCERLARRLPRSAAAGLVVLGALLLVGGTLALLARVLADQIPDVADAVQEAYGDVAAFTSERFDTTLPNPDEALDELRRWAGEAELGQAGRSFAIASLEVLSTILLILVALFFYLKDGARLARFLVELAPARARADVAEIVQRVWGTLGGYFRGQLIVAAVDAFFIGIGLVVLGVPLALPLATFVFLGGLFPIVGAFTAGALAVLVALADGGPTIALAVLALNVVVQQVEGNLLEPLVVGRATALHPLVVLASLTAGAVTLGILGAFLAVPVTASVVRAVGYGLEQRRGETPSAEPPDRSTT